MIESERALLRHTLATLAYRAAKPLRDAPPMFAAFRAAPGTRTAVEILAHMGDLLDWALSIAQGRERWRNSTPLDWDAELSRFFDALRAFDNYLAGDDVLSVPAEKLFQGPVADALTHTGQLTMLRRIAGSPVRGENYYVARINSGSVGLDQPEPKREFD
jgi:hypothetical protein